jgi:hypothetical protein
MEKTVEVILQSQKKKKLIINVYLLPHKSNCIKACKQIINNYTFSSSSFDGANLSDA